MSHAFGAKYGVHTLEALRQRTVLDEETGCWIWRAATSREYPRVWTSDSEGGPSRAMTGTKASWHLAGNKCGPGQVVYRTCEHKCCVNPDHLRVGTKKEACKFLADSNRLKGQINRQIANKANGMKRSKLTPELIAEIRGSDEQARAMAKRLDVSESLISACRLGKRGNQAVSASSVFGWRP